MVMSGSGVMEFVPDPSKPGLLIGSDFTAFFTATVRINKLLRALLYLSLIDHASSHTLIKSDFAAFFTATE